MSQREIDKLSEKYVANLIVRCERNIAERRFLRKIFGPFLWRYHLDRLLVWALRMLPRRDKPRH